MVPFTAWRIFTFSIFLLFFLCTDSCTEREWANPFDDLDPATWAPGNLQVEDVSITEKKLTWTYLNKNIEGFKLDRKKGDEVWQEAFQTFSKETRSCTDTDITPDPALTYSYRLYAYAGKNVSVSETASSSGSIAAPSDLQITNTSVASVTLSWQDNCNGEEGFIIDRKIAEGTWQVAFAIVSPNSESYTDNSVNLEGNYYSYRVYAYFNNYNSTSIENMIGLPPTVTTSSISNYSYNSATCGGIVTACGSSAVTARGVCWSTLQNPTIADEHTSDGSGNGAFISNITGLSPITTYYIRAYANNSYGTSYGNQVIVITDAPPCGVSFTLTHSIGSIAPVIKIVTYGTVETNLTGSNKCLITQNLGADHQANAVTDATEASAGWYWQFNKKQGYKHDGTTRTPNTAWVSSINEDSDWLPANDPCAMLLGSGWRLPTKTEWSNVFANGGWNNYNDAFSSVLKLHAAGYLLYSDGSLDFRGSGGNYWSSTQGDNSSGWHLGFGSGDCFMFNHNKAYGFSGRCLRDF